MQSNKTSITIVVGVVALVVGALAGYFYGQNVGAAKGASAGREQLLAEQANTAAEANATRMAELQEAANPFKDSYQNPFAQ